MTAQDAAARVDHRCAAQSDGRELTYIGWEVTGTAPGPASAQQFSLTYEEDRGRTGRAELPVAITLCEPGEETGPCSG